MSELKPCPFCGGEAKVKAYSNGGNICFRVMCDDCRVAQDGIRNGYYDEEQAVKAWNRRASETNREWLKSLSNKQLAEFLTSGLYVHDLYVIEGNLPEGAVFVRDRVMNFNAIKMRYIQSHTGVEHWLNSPQEFEVIPEIE